MIVQYQGKYPKFGGVYIWYEQGPQPPQVRTLNLLQRAGGSITSDIMTGYDGDIATVTNTTDIGYSFGSYAVTGSTFTGNQIQFDGSDIFVIPSFVHDVYNINLLQTTGGTITANKTTGYYGDIITLSNTADPNYTFSGYNITGASLNQDNESFYIQNNDVNVKGKFISELGPVITEVWVYIDRIPSGDSSKIIQVYTLKLNEVGIVPSIVEGKQAQLQTWYDDTEYAYQFNYNDNCYSPQRSDTDSIRFKLPTIPSDNDEISYGPYNPWWCYDTTCQVRLVGKDINDNEYIIANSGYNQQTYYNNNKQRVQLTYTAP